MTKLPQIRPRDLLRFFKKQGYAITRQTGSHARLVDNKGHKITIAVHNKPIAPGTLHSILKQVGMDRNMLLKLFKK